jgi:hypothetical protein
VFNHHAVRAALIGVLAATAALGLPAMASASGSSVWVSGSAPVSAPGKSCASPAYNSIQSAIDAAASGATIHVCSGTYAEQLTITKSLKLKAEAGAKLTLPPTPADTSTTCDATLEKAGYQADQDAISICTPGTVTMAGLTVEAKWPAGTCDNSLYGIIVLGGATLKATSVDVTAAGAGPINGCQGGVGIEVGSARPTTAEVGHATLTNDAVSGYQKNGITVEGEGSTAKIRGTTVTGAGPTPETAQNGIQISYGATGSIKHSTVTGNECDNSTCGANAFENKFQATGVLFYLAGSGSTVVGSTIKENDDGVYNYSGATTQPSSPEVTLSGDTLTSNRYEGMSLDQGNVLIKKDTINGTGNIGIDLYQYEGQAFAPNSSAMGDSIEGQEVAVEVQSDKAPGDLPGNFTISKSSISKNTKEVEDESTNFTVTKSKDS